LAAIAGAFNFDISMIKYFKTFFYPTVLAYSYYQPKELVIEKIRNWHQSSSAERRMMSMAWKENNH
jgi:hypothetical protein